jgi:hypothetical protein
MVAKKGDYPGLDWATLVREYPSTGMLVRGRIFMGSALRFSWGCIREAADGTLDRANAWFWPIGIPIVAFAGWYWGVGQLTIPDTPQGFITFMVVTVGVSWVVFFLIRLVGAPARLYAKLEGERNALQARLDQHEASRAQLSIGELYRVRTGETVSWRIKVRNDGAPANHVQVSLRGIAPPPKCEYWTAEYPYRIVQPGLTLDSNDCHLNKGDAANFNILSLSKAIGAPGPFVTTLDTRPSQNQILIYPFEIWTMEYEVTSENSTAITFTAITFVLKMLANDGGIMFVRAS